MTLFSLIDDFSTFVQALTDRYSIEEIARSTRISVDDLKRWRHGLNHSRPQVEWLLYGFCVNQQAFDLLAPVLPAFDRQEKFNLDSPPLGYDVEVPQIQLRNRPTKIAGLTVNFPSGIGASILTRNSSTIAFYAARGFDILTYKTVRSVKRDVHEAPNWVFIHSDTIDKVVPPFDSPVIGDPDPNYWPEDPRHAAMANSFGVPSPEPAVWQPDVEKAKQSLRPGQILIVSVVASPPQGDRSEKTLRKDFVRVAKLAKEAGADIVEANYSCPNTPHDPTGELYQDPELAGRVSKDISNAIKPTPLFVKIGYLEKSRLAEFVHHNREHVRGIVAINTIRMRVESPSGTQLFPGSGRDQAGISGVAIRPWAMDVVRNLVTIREQKKAQNEFDIIAVGGVSTPQNIYDYLNLGADAAESCTAAYLNPYLAIEARQQLLIRTGMVKPTEDLVVLPDSSTPQSRRDLRSPALDRETGASPPKHQELQEGGPKMDSSPRWTRSFDSYSREELRALRFQTREDVYRAIAMTWRDSDLKGVPHDIASEGTLVVPEEAIEYFKAKGLQFEIFKILNDKDIAPKKLAELRKKYGM